MFKFILGERWHHIDAVKTVYNTIRWRPMAMPVNKFITPKDVEPTLKYMGLLRQTWLYYRNYTMVKNLKGLNRKG
jgi:hypothetical protein